MQSIKSTHWRVIIGRHGIPLIKNPEAMERTINILVVDDSEISTISTQRLFAKSGYHVDIALNGMQAMEKLMDNKYDAVVTDLSMPYVSGQQLIKAIKRNGYDDMKIIVVTSTNNEATISEVLAGGADDYILKPFKASELFNRVIKLIEE